MDLSIFFAGTAGSIPTARRGLPALLVRRGGDRILFDCGEGTQRQLVSSIGLTDLTEIFLTHFHADHWLGLPGMLKTFDLRGRERPLTIYGPRGLQALLGLVLRMGGRVGFELQVVELVAGDVLERDGYRIAPVEVAHRGPAFGYVLYEDERPGVFDPARRGRARAGARTRVRSRPARRDGPRRAPGAGDGADPARAQARDLGRHAAVRVAADRRPPGRRARPRGDVRRGGARPRRADRSLHRGPGGDARGRGRGRAAGAQPRLHPPSGRGAARRGARDLPGHGDPARLRHDRGPVRRAGQPALVVRWDAAAAPDGGDARRRPAARRHGGDGGPTAPGRRPTRTAS